MQHQIMFVGFISLPVMVVAGCGSSVEHEHSSYSSPDTNAEHTRTRIHVTSGDRSSRNYDASDRPLHIHIHPGGSDMRVEIERR